MHILDFAQGSTEWKEHRASHFNASDAPAMMGVSPYKTRTQLLCEIATGVVPEIDAATQRRFDDGHRFEALARSLAEKTIGESLFPVVGYEGKLSASFDGLTMDESICWEHKTINQSYRDAVSSFSSLPLALLIQIEQQLMISGAIKFLFTATAWVDEACVEAIETWVESDPALRSKILQGWTQFAIDLENYVPAEVIVEPVADTIKALPALMIQVEGKVLATNLDQFKAAAQTFIANINTDLQTDQHFADADKMVKFLKDGEERLALCKSQALSQTASIDELFRTIDAISGQMKDKRLMLDKLVTAEKANRKTEIVTTAMKTLIAHVDALNKRIGGEWMPPTGGMKFIEVTKGLKSLDSMREKVSSALANAKIEANEIADLIECNAKYLKSLETPHDIAPDFATICTKTEIDFSNLIARRVTAIMEAESVKVEAAKKAEDARIASAVEAERRAGEARAAAAIEAERMAEAKRVAEMIELDRQTKVDESSRAYLETKAQEEVPPLTPIGSIHGIVSDKIYIDDFLTMLAMSQAEKKALRIHLVKFVKYAAAREIQAAA